MLNCQAVKYAYFMRTRYETRSPYAGDALDPPLWKVPDKVRVRDARPPALFRAGWVRVGEGSIGMGFEFARVKGGYFLQYNTSHVHNLHRK
jgi:hypothetical protein